MFSHRRVGASSTEFLVIGLLAFSLAACERGGDNAAEAAKLMETSREWSRVTATGNNQAILDYWADDAVIMPPDSPTIRGKDAIRASRGDGTTIPGVTTSWEPLEAKVSGDMGYLIERTQMSMKGGDGQVATQQFRGVTIWRKQADGSWKNVVDISNRAAPPAQLR